MHQDDKFYTFLLSHFNKTKQYVSRAEVSKKISLVTLFGILLTIGIFSAIFIKNNISAESKTPVSKIPANNPQFIQQTKAEYKSINYARPSSSEDYNVNSGGPIDGLTEN